MLPSGYGKSAIFQSIALLSQDKKVVVVIEPLISIIQDQSVTAKTYGICNTAFLPAYKSRNTIPGSKLIFITPERLSNLCLEEGS